MSEQAKLKDILNYPVDSYITEQDRQIIKDHFHGNWKLLEVVRKVFMPTITDGGLPVEEMAKDMWFAGTDFAALTKDEAYVRILARQEAIKFVAGGIMSLKQIAHISEESASEKALRRAKDSAK